MGNRVPVEAVIRMAGFRALAGIGFAVVDFIAALR